MKLAALHNLCVILQFFNHSFYCTSSFIWHLALVYLAKDTIYDWLFPENENNNKHTEQNCFVCSRNTGCPKQMVHHKQPYSIPPQLIVITDMPKHSSPSEVAALFSHHAFMAGLWMRTKHSALNVQKRCSLSAWYKLSKWQTAGRHEHTRVHRTATRKAPLTRSCQPVASPSEIC